MWLTVWFALHLGPWVESDERIAPGVGLRVETDRCPIRPAAAGPDDRLLARAADPGVKKGRDNRQEPADPGVKKDATDYRPPRDKAADRIDASAAGVRPVFVTKNQTEVARMSDELGKPTVWWSFWPDSLDTTAELFNELGEATHL